MNKEERLKIFILLLLIAFLYWRISVFVFYNYGDMGFLRETTGLNVHHYHYGIIFILIAALIMIFHKINGFSVGVMGFGIGSVADSFISRLLSNGGTRVGEIANYNEVLLPTLFLFGVIILISIMFYLTGKD